MRTTRFNKRSALFFTLLSAGFASAITFSQAAAAWSALTTYSLSIGMGLVVGAAVMLFANAFFNALVQSAKVKVPLKLVLILFASAVIAELSSIYLAKALQSSMASNAANVLSAEVGIALTIVLTLTVLKLWGYLGFKAHAPIKIIHADPTAPPSERLANKKTSEDLRMEPENLRNAPSNDHSASHSSKAVSTSKPT